MNLHIEKPSEGSVTIVMGYDDAEVLCRAVGMVNEGSLRTASPTLHSIMQTLLEEFSRNTSEARKYIGSVVAGQVYVDEKD